MPGPTHIAYLFSRYPVVSQTFCDSEMLALEARGQKITIASLNAPPSSFRHEQVGDLQAEAVYLPPAPLVKARFKAAKSANAPETADFFRLLEDHENRYGPDFKSDVRARNALAMADLLKRRGVDHIHVHFANRATHTALFLKQLGFTFSFTAHAQDFMLDLGSDELLAEMCEAAEFTVAVSDYSKELLQAKCPNAATKIHRVYNGILPEKFDNAFSFGGDRLKVVSVGRLIEFKGFHYLIAACAKLKQDGVPVDCTIVGDGPWREQLEAMAADVSAGDIIHFAGILSQGEVKSLLAESDVFCLPSIIDSKGASDILPTVILEAMAAGIPVVSSQLVGIPEMVEQGVTGLLVQPGDMETLAEALKYFFNEPAKRNEFGAAGREKLIAQFHRELTSEQLHTLFQSVEIPLPPSAAPREVIYYASDFEGEDGEWSAAVREDSVWPIAAQLLANSVSDGMEFFPDGVVLEGEWYATGPSLSASIDLWRNELGSDVDGEWFYREARRALHLASLARKANVRGIYGRRSSEALCLWIVRRVTDVPVSIAIEEEPEVSRRLLETLLPEFSLVSCSDKKLSESLDGEVAEHLPLRREPTHEKKKLGPIRWKTRREEPAEESAERKKLAAEWIRSVVRAHTDSTP